MIARALAGLGAMNDPSPRPSRPASMSRGAGSIGGGFVPLVGAFGRARSATYRQVYLMNPWVYSATNYISRGIGRLPLHTFGLDERGDKIRIRSDIPQTQGRPSGGVMLDRFLSNPTPGRSRRNVVRGTVNNWIVQGNGMWEITGYVGATPSEGRMIPWTRVVDVAEQGGDVLFYLIADGDGGPLGSGGSTRKLYPEQVIHFGLGSDGDGACGVSLLESCHHTLALHEAVMRHLFGYLENGARPSAHFKVQTAKQAEEARAFLTAMYTSPENAGKVLISNAEWQSISDSPDHAQLIELIKESRVEIAAAFQVPPPILGLLENAIRANVKELREQFGRETIGPWAGEFEGELEAQLLPRSPAWNGLMLEFQLAEQLRPDLEARALVYQRLMWVLSIDEIRKLENLPPLRIPGVTDVPWVASGALPVTTAAVSPRGGRGTPPPPAGGGQAQPEGEGVPLDQAALVVRLLDQLDHKNGVSNGNGNGHNLIGAAE